jgi:hypothetical protein
MKKKNTARTWDKTKSNKISNLYAMTLDMICG